METLFNFKNFGMPVNGKTMCQVVGALAAKEVLFAVVPMPDDEYRIVVCYENARLLEKLVHHMPATLPELFQINQLQ